jgi:phosphate starvation-inducible PhoH-like protein
MLAVVAAIKAFREGVIQKIVVTRPAVGVDEEEHGFLPGDLNEKMAPWTRPIFDVMKEYFSTKEIAMMLEDETIEISPLAYMRGRNFKDAWIIADEMQNASVNQMKMILTRLGENSRIVVTGDLNQTDKKFQHDNGLIDFLTKLNDSPRRSMGLTQFERKDVQRSKVVSEVLDLYGED